LEKGGKTQASKGKGDASEVLSMMYKILVGDSSPSIQKIVQMAFPESEFTVYTFSEGKQVLEMAELVNPDAVLLNLSLADKDGPTVARELKSREKFVHIPLVFLRSAFDTSSVEDLETLEYHMIVQEPFDSEDLVREVREVLDKKNNPPSLPEEPVLGSDARGTLFSELEIKVKTLVREELASVKKELEEKIKTQVAEELKEFFKKEKY
jgi:DNA-binding response OmpR family regulator